MMLAAGFRSGVWPILFRIAVAAALLGILLSKLLSFDAGFMLFPQSWMFAILAFTAVVFCEGSSGLRLASCSRLVSSGLPIGEAIAIHISALPFQLSLPSGLGGDAFKLRALTLRDISLTKAVIIVGLDRSLGALALLILSLTFGLPLIANSWHTVADTRWIWIAVVVVLIAGVGLAWAWHSTSVIARLREFLTLFYDCFRRPLRILLVLAISCFAQLWLTLAVLALLWGYGHQLHWSVALGASSTAIIISMLPISLGGLGIREGALTVLLITAGIPAPDAIAVSIQFGAAILASSFLGLAAWLAGVGKLGLKT
jgi:uncharacterized membrane protein YbhN (UPF0104 family)